MNSLYWSLKWPGRINIGIWNKQNVQQQQIKFTRSKIKEYSQTPQFDTDTERAIEIVRITTVSGVSSGVNY